MRKLVAAVVAVLLAAVVAGTIYWVATKDRRLNRQVYDCRERTGENLPLAVDLTSLSARMG
jgi:uncharacterized protein (DUF58 family)